MLQTNKPCSWVHDSQAFATGVFFKSAGIFSDHVVATAAPLSVFYPLAEDVPDSSECVASAWAWLLRLLWLFTDTTIGVRDLICQRCCFASCSTLRSIDPYITADICKTCPLFWLAVWHFNGETRKPIWFNQHREFINRISRNTKTCQSNIYI